MKLTRDQLGAFQVRDNISEAIDQLQEFDGNITYFEDDGVLSNDLGFTLKGDDGEEFQITIVRSKSNDDI